VRTSTNGHFVLIDVPRSNNLGWVYSHIWPWCLFQVINQSIVSPNYKLRSARETPSHTSLRETSVTLTPLKRASEQYKSANRIPPDWSPLPSSLRPSSGWPQRATSYSDTRQQACPVLTTFQHRCPKREDNTTWTLDHICDTAITLRS
jgi:hypothetical protein